MRRFGSAFAVAVLLLFALGCGSGNSSRQLQSMDIRPATANGEVQFMATGHYNQAPVTMSPLPAMWVVYLPGGKSGATITQSGVAQCVAGVAGTFSILAYAPADPRVPIAELITAKKVLLGTANLSCP